MEDHERQRSFSSSRLWSSQRSGRFRVELGLLGAVDLMRTGRDIVSSVKSALGVFGWLEKIVPKGCVDVISHITGRISCSALAICSRRDVPVMSVICLTDLA